jgi:hypothetical protein
LADKLVELEIVEEEISYQTVRRTLKKTLGRQSHLEIGYAPFLPPMRMTPGKEKPDGPSRTSSRRH